MILPFTDSPRSFTAHSLLLGGSVGLSDFKIVNNLLTSSLENPIILCELRKLKNPLLRRTGALPSPCAIAPPR